jgi:hypothetical protein
MYGLSEWYLINKAVLRRFKNNETTYRATEIGRLKYLRMRLRQSYNHKTPPQLF